MSNLDKVVKLLSDANLPGRTLHPRQVQAIAATLEAAGLLAPDLPDANDPGIFVPDGKGWRIGDASVWTAPASTVMIQNVEPGDLSPTIARELAYTLLAAATYAEKEQGNE